MGEKSAAPNALYFYAKMEVKMKKLIKVIGVVALIVTIGKLYGYIQQDHFECQIVDIRDNVLYFEAYNGNVYGYETSNSDEFEIGETYKVDFFDFEDLNAENNVIVKVHRNNEGNQ